MSTGDHIHLSVVGRSLVLEQQRDAVAELRALGNSVPASRSLVEELPTDRERAAATE